MTPSSRKSNINVQLDAAKKQKGLNLSPAHAKASKASSTIANGVTHSSRRTYIYTPSSRNKVLEKP